MSFSFHIVFAFFIYVRGFHTRPGNYDVVMKKPKGKINLIVYTIFYEFFAYNLLNVHVCNCYLKNRYVINE